MIRTILESAITNRYPAAALTFITIILISYSSTLAVSKVSRTMNFVDFYAGGSMPTGQRDGLPDYEFLINNRSAEVNSDDIYGNTFHLGFSYGQLRASHFLWSMGLKYIDHKVYDTIPLPFDSAVIIDYDPTYRQLDIGFNFNLYLTDPMKTGLAPYAGVGVNAGILAIDDDINETDYSANLGMSLNFGADLKIWSSPDARSFVALSSVNSYDFYGSNDRPKYLNIGGAIKYYFRP